MTTLYVVRHGRVAPNPVDKDNPQLGPDGREQAEAVALHLNSALPGPLAVVTSPLLRCRETAAPLCALWKTSPVVEPRMAEVPGPAVSAMPRDEWLRRALQAQWPDLIELGRSLQAGYEMTLRNWRRGVLEAALAQDRDTVIFSHFVPVNVLTGHATGSQRVACFLPAHTSVTIFETSGANIRLIERGREMRSQKAPEPSHHRPQ
jgi:broad specificity phosphatase PhoE